MTHLEQLSRAGLENALVSGLTPEAINDAKVVAIGYNDLDGEQEDFVLFTSTEEAVAFKRNAPLSRVVRFFA